jgi:peptidoglycan/LPS O-acetylase OafA/YrhL
MNPGVFTLQGFISTVLPLADIHKLESGTFVAMAWAVAVEFQFYLIFPFILASLNRTPWKTVIGIIACALFFRILTVALGGNARDISYWHLVGRIDEFVLGMGAAVVLREFSLSAKSCRLIFVAAATLIAMALCAFHSAGGWRSEATWKILWPTIEGAAYAAFIVGYVGWKDFLPSFISRTLAKVGEASFSIYLLHPVIIDILVRTRFILRPTGRDEWDAIFTACVIAVPLVLVGAMLTYHVIEKPFLRRRMKYLVQIREPSEIRAA